MHFGMRDEGTGCLDAFTREERLDFLQCLRANEGESYSALIFLNERGTTFTLGLSRFRFPTIPNRFKINVFGQRIVKRIDSLL